MLETRVRAKSWESRRKAGESSSKKLARSCETSYCSRNRYEGFWYSTLPCRSVSATLMLTTTKTLAACPVVELYVSGDAEVESTVPRNVASAASPASFRM